MFKNLFKKLIVKENIGIRKNNIVISDEELEIINPYASTNCSSPNLTSLNILVIDDNISFQEIMAVFLKKHGHIVECGDNGQIGIEKYLSNHDKYDIILVDMEMPVMNGDEMARQIRTSGLPTAKTIPIIVMSGNITNMNMDEFGATLFLRKPFELNKVLIAIRQVLTKNNTKNKE